MSDQANTDSFVGQSVERVEDGILLTGRARFSDHQPTITGTLHAAMVRSPHAHAEIVSIDKSKALALAGVSAVLTGEDLTELASAFLIVIKQPMQHYSLAVGKVRYVGEPVAVVVATNRYIAEDALDLIEVEYGVLDAVVDPIAATKSDAPVLYDEVGANVVSTREFSYGDPDKAFAEADKVVSLTAPYPRNSQTPLEGFVVNAEYIADTDSYDVASNYQGPFTSHPVMALALGVPSSHLRMRVPAFSGGGFGVKVQIFPYVVLMCLCSKVTGHPVKWVEDRLEHLSAAAAAPNRVTQIEAACKSDGTVTAFRFDQLDDYGAYLRAPMPGPLYRMHGTLTGAYHIKNLAVKNRVVMTNKCPSGMIRGFGGPQMYFAIERLMHRVAVELDLDPLDVIRKNLVPADSFPYRAAAGALFDSGDYQTAVAKAVDEGGLEELKRRRDAARADGKLYGIGYSVVVEPAHSNMGYLSNILPVEERRRNPKGGAVSNATVNVDPLGTVSVTADSLPQGQGHATVLSQIVADELGLKPTDISVNMELDTQKDAWSIATGNYSARFSSSTTVAAHKAAVKVRDKIARIAAVTLNVSVDQVEFANGKIFATDNPENSLKFYRVAGSAHWTPGSLPDGMDPGIRETGTWSPPELEPPNDQDQINTSLTYGFVFDYCGVEIDRDTGQVHIDKFVTMHDSGTLLNPMLAAGQVYGAFSWAVGCALFEEFAYGDDGSFLSGTFADYLCPTAPEVPQPLILHMETPSIFTPLGAKGIGEGNVMSTPACLSNAVCDALDIKFISLPMSPSKISALIQPEEKPPPEGAAKQPEAAPSKGGRVIRGSGETQVPAAPEEVWLTLLDPDKLAAVIPGCHSLDKVGENSYRAEVSLGVGVVRGRFSASVDMSDMDPPNALRLSGGVQGPLGASRGAGNVRLEARDGGTHVTYDYTVEISGKVAAVGGRMLEGAARIVIGQFFERLVSQVGGPSPAGTTLWQRILRAFGIGR